MANNKKEMDMLHGPMWKNILAFAIPLALTSIMQQLFHSVDTAVVGKFCGPNELAAVGSNGSIINLLVNMFMGFSAGANVVIAQFIGAKKNEEAKKAVGTSLSIAIVSGFIVMLMGIFISPHLLKLISSPPEVIGLATIYLRIYFLGIPFLMIYNFSAAILRSRGETTKQFYCLLAGGITNVILNLILVIVFKIGVSGVAIATAISNIISCLLILTVLIKDTSSLKISAKEIRPDKLILKKIVKIGLPMSIQSCLFPLSNMIIQSSVNSLGALVVAGNAAAASIETFNYSIETSFAQATVSFVSQNYGAGNLKRCRQVLKISAALGIVITSVFSLLMYIFIPQVLGLYTTDKSVYEYALLRITIMYTTFSGWMLINQLTSALRGLGYSAVPTIVSVAGVCGFRILWVYTVFKAFKSYMSVLIVYPASWAIVFTALIICYIVILKKETNKLNPEHKEL